MLDQAMTGKPSWLQETDDTHRRAVTFTLFLAGKAVPTTDPWENKNLLADFHGGDVFTNGCHHSGNLMSQGSGKLQTPIRKT